VKLTNPKLDPEQAKDHKYPPELAIDGNLKTFAHINGDMKGKRSSFKADFKDGRF